MSLYTISLFLHVSGAIGACVSISISSSALPPFDGHSALSRCVQSPGWSLSPLPSSGCQALSRCCWSGS